jgi:hypothetical protein
MVGMKTKSLSIPDRHQRKIAIDTVRNPMKGMLGGMNAAEAESILGWKFGFSPERIARLKA